MSFEPKTAVVLDPPKDNLFTPSELAQFDGSDPLKPIYVAIKGTVFDVSKNKDAYGTPGKGYSIFAGKEPNRALAKSSLNPDDCVHEYGDLDESERKTLDDWYIFFSKRYNIVGKVKRDGASGH